MHKGTIALHILTNICFFVFLIIAILMDLIIIHWWLVMSNSFSRTCWSSVCILWGKICILKFSNFLIKLLWVYIFCYWVVWVTSIFWILTTYQIYLHQKSLQENLSFHYQMLQILPPSTWYLIPSHFHIFSFFWHQRFSTSQYQKLC